MSGHRVCGDMCRHPCGERARTVVCGASESEPKMRSGGEAGEISRAGLRGHAAAVVSQTAPRASTSMSAQCAGGRFLGVGAIWLSLLCGLGASGCGISQLGPLMSEPNATIAPISLILDSVPSGAEARIRDGSSCHTPCELSIMPMGPFMVDFTLQGYEPQSAEVILAAVNPEDISAGIRLDPSPLTVELTAIPQPSPPARPKTVAKQPPTSPTTSSAPSSATGSTPSSTTGSTRPGAAGFYWPQFPGH